MLTKIKHLIETHNNIHRPSDKPNIFLFSSPRGGSTWLMELVLTQPGFKPCDEPFDLRKPFIKENLSKLGLSTWSDLYNPDKASLVEEYVNAICNGSLHSLDRFFHRNHYRLITRRVIFKILHAGEDRINWFADRFNGKIIFLLRHPIPVSLSRKFLPRLHTFLNGDFKRHFTKDQLDYADNIFNNGTKLEQSVLDWCFQNSIPLRDATTDWIVVSYEQLVVDPMPVINLITEKLAFEKPNRIIKQLSVPSASTRQSDEETKQRLSGSNGITDRTWLVEKWRDKLTAEEEHKAMEILKVFDIDVYNAGSAIPNDRIWIDH